MNFKTKINLFLVCLLLPLYLLASSNEAEVLKKQALLTREKSLNVSITYGNGFITISKLTTKNVYEGEFVYEKSRPDIRYDIVGDEGRLQVYFSGKVRKDSRDEDARNISSITNLYDNELRLHLSPEIPINLDLELGMIKGNLDLSGLKIQSLNMEIGVSKGTIVFDEPNPIKMENCTIEGGVGKLNIERLGNARVKNFSFEGGVGSYVLDFSGEYKLNTNANITIGMGKVTLYLPRYIGTRLKVDKSFLSSFSIDKIYKEGDYYYNDNWEKTRYNLDMKVEAGVGKVDVVWVDE
ncbi:MAG: hypothetical protein Kow0042_01300 [Calditrichia bacterium]